VLAVFLIQTLPFLGMGWDALTGGPELGLVQDVRQSLLEQEPFRRMLADHEREALSRFRTSKQTVYQERHLVRVSLTPFGLPGFHDVFAVRVRTDVIDERAYTSFLARPGVVFDSNAAPFFSRQCQTATCTAFIDRLVGTGHWLLRHGVLTPFRLNVTETDETSSVSPGRDPVSTQEWSRQSRKLHEKRIGRSFLDTQP
jgi:hypothetical protein